MNTPPIHETLCCQSHEEIHIFSSDSLIEYPSAVAFMEEYVTKIRAGTDKEAIWFLEHPDIYTAGTSAKSADLLMPQRFPVYDTGRGGQYTYHGPGQLIVYVMLDLHKRKIGVREFVKSLETLIINTLKHYDITAYIRDGRVGVWIDATQTPTGTEDKIAAIGVRIRKGVSFHGFAVNLACNLQAFEGIIPCGLKEFGVTSLKELNKDYSRHIFENNIKNEIKLLF